MDAKTLKSERRVLVALAIGGMLLSMGLARPIEAMVARGATVLRVLDRYAFRPAVDSAAAGAREAVSRAGCSLEEWIGSPSRDGEPPRHPSERKAHKRIAVVHWHAEPVSCVQDT